MQQDHVSVFNIMYIYLIENLISNKKYVGKCSRIPEKSKAYYGSGTYIKSAIKKYGKQNFKKEILEKCESEKLLNERERYWIKELNTISPIGYNLTTGGEEGKKLSPESIKKLSEKNKLLIGPLNSRWGKKLTEEHKQRLREFNTGRPKLPETIEKLRLAGLGKKRSLETRQKIRDAWAKRNYKMTEKQREKFLTINNKKKLKVYQIHKHTGETLNTFESLSEAQKQTKIFASSICKCLQGELKTAGKFKWRLSKKEVETEC